MQVDGLLSYYDFGREDGIGAHLFICHIRDVKTSETWSRVEQYGSNVESRSPPMMAALQRGIEAYSTFDSQKAVQGARRTRVLKASSSTIMMIIPKHPLFSHLPRCGEELSFVPSPLTNVMT
jgi:hypothetical protein